MRIMLDTNVLISALLFPGTKMDAMMNYIFTNHQLVLSSYVVDELKNVVRRKFPGKEMIINKLLMMMSFEYVYTLVVWKVDYLISEISKIIQYFIRLLLRMLIFL